jgi:hypothetical protein
MGLMSGILQVSAQTVPNLSVNGKKSADVYLQSLDIQVDVMGNIASTKFVMVFRNRTERVLEGELLFPLPDGVTVSHYALDINGKMREAVPVEKAKATQVFEEIEQRRVDPGILERVEGNNFRTRIYPVPAKGTRTVSIAYEQELPLEKDMLRYRLPMDYENTIDNFSVKATVWQSKAKPRVDGGLPGELTFDAQDNNYVATFVRKNYRAQRSFAFSLPLPADHVQTVMQPASGSYYFVTSCFLPSGTRPRQWSERLGIIWDASLSGLQRDTGREMEMLNVLFGEVGNCTVELYLLNNSFTFAGTFPVGNGDWGKLRKCLEETVYDGGTDYSAIELNNNNVSEYLFFSDGLSTLSDADFIIPTYGKRSGAVPDFRLPNTSRPVHCVVSSPKADYSALKWIASQTGGKFINMNSLSADGVKEAVLLEDLCFMGVDRPSSVREVCPSVPAVVQGCFSVAGIMDAPCAEITLMFGYGKKVEKRMTVVLKAGNASRENSVHRIWAQKKISELDMHYDRNKDELTELGQQFGIVTRNTSLIVLETLQDYITYNITPPAELQNEYLRWKKIADETRNRRDASMMAAALSAAEDLMQWWKKDFTPDKRKYPKPDNAAAPSPLVIVEEEIQIADDGDMLYAPAESEAMKQEEISVIAYGVQRQSATAGAVADGGDVFRRSVAENREAPLPPRSQPLIHLTPIRQDSEYMKNLTGKANADYSLYLQARPNYINTPAFYFDMADWFFHLKDREKALRILTSIADTDLENAALFRLLAYRMKEYGEYEMEAYLCKKVIDWRPVEPQNYRNYALALADAGKTQNALDALYAVLSQSCAGNIIMRSAGIEEVAVTELNRLIALNRQLKTSNIDKKLIGAMPVDIRVVLNWNINSTDIDLHVKDPNGETCYYQNKRTALGGRISSDITQGYGPEQFLLKKAVRGKYEVFVNCFGDSQVKAEGPSTLMLEIFTGYSDSSEKRQIVCLQMSKEKGADGNGLIKVAEFEF